MTIQNQVDQINQQIEDQKALIKILTGEERHQAICALGELILRLGELSNQGKLGVDKTDKL